MTNNDIEELRKDYRAIEAPPALATRIRAHADARQTRRRRWIPATVGAALAVTAAFLLLTTLLQEQHVATTLVADNTEPKPSMASLARVMNKRPSVSAPSLSQVRTRTLPAPPRKPVPQTDKPPATKSYLDIPHSIAKEKDHAHS
ncbi:MAG: hypothetical protein QNJ14_13135 [Woeseiaceae bacterium]|nr:hypothetical protein [Woeseiaceae bacterium]